MGTLVLTAMKSAMEAREEKEDSTTVDTTEERVERDTVVARLSATRLSVILLLTAMVTTAVLTHAFTAEKEERDPRVATDVATTVARVVRDQKEDTTTTVEAASTARGDCKRMIRSLSTTPWHSILISKRVFV